MKTETFKRKLKECGLKVTPQRIAVLEAVSGIKSHPTAEEVSAFIRKYHPNIATGTVYKTLDTMVEKGIIRKVKTDGDTMRYDAITGLHHHLYCMNSDRISDYFDEDLDQLLKSYFKKKKIRKFKIEEIKLQIIGRFKDKVKTMK